MPTDTPSAPTQRDLEIRRIRDAYAHYAADPREQKRRDEANPGLSLIRAELRSHLMRMLDREGVDLANTKVLDIGCGDGDVLGWLIEAGALESNCAGVDLIPERAQVASDRFPQARIACGDAGSLEFEDSSFDLVVMSMVVSSVRSDELASDICAEARRVLRPGGRVAWYDTRQPNPWNRRVRAVTRRKVCDLFPGAEVRLASLTVVPPIARVLGRRAPTWYPRLARIPFLRVRYFGLFEVSPNQEPG